MESLRSLSSSPASAYDELVTGQKSIRYHWQGILSIIRTLPGGLAERVESARRQLEETDDTVVAIAARCGFGTAETMRRNFIRRVGVSPDQYRKTFA